MSNGSSTVVVGVDGSAASDAAIRWSVREAVMRALPLTLIHVVRPNLVSTAMGATVSSVTLWQEEQARQIIDRARLIAEEAGGTRLPDVQTELPYARVVPALVDGSTDAHMIVVGSRGAGAFRRHILGSVSSGVLDHAQCPVGIIHDAESAQQEIRDDAPVLVGIDGSPAAEAATAWAFDEASRRGVALVALHAWSDVGVFPMLGMDWRTYRDQGEEVLAERLAGWQQRYPDVRVQRRLVCDVPARWLVEAAKNAQLVVLGSHGRGGYAGMHLGSVSAAVTQSARVPVVVVRVGAKQLASQGIPTGQE